MDNGGDIAKWMNRHNDQVMAAVELGCCSFFFSGFFEPPLFGGNFEPSLFGGYFEPIWLLSWLALSLSPAWLAVWLFVAWFPDPFESPTILESMPTLSETNNQKKVLPSFSCSESDCEPG